jgi:hypothetical protein
VDRLVDAALALHLADHTVVLGAAAELLDRKPVEAAHQLVPGRRLERPDNRKPGPL